MTTQTDRIAGLVGNLAFKAPVRLATTANIALTGLLVVDAVQTVAGDRVLVKDQTAGAENGIYAASATAWVREPDWDGARDVVTGTMVRVSAGTANGARTFAVSTTGGITVGTTAVVFTSAFGGVAVDIHAATSKATPIDADELGVWDSVSGLLNKLTWANLKATLLATWKDTTGGLVGLTLFKINFKNAANTFTSFFTNTNTAARTYTFQDRNGTIADDADLATKAALAGSASQTFSVAAATSAAHAVRLDQLGESSVTNRTAGNVTTSSTSLVDLTDASITLTTKARRIAFAFSCMASNDTANASNVFNINIDGTLLYGTDGLGFEVNAPNDARIITISGVTATLTEASHTIKVQWKVDAASTGTVYATAVNTFRFSAWEV